MSTETAERTGTATLAATPPIELGVMNPITGPVQQVLDENGNPTALYLGSAQVAVGTATPGFPFVVDAAPMANAIAQLHARGGESSLEFVNTGDGVPWRIGTGGGAGEKAFFLWNGPVGIVLSVLGNTVDFRDSTVKIRNLALTGLSPIGTAPADANLESVVVDTKTGKLYYL